EANATAGYSTTAHGDPSNMLEAVLNLPVIADKFALRGVVYNDSRGGYINNIPGTFARRNTDIGIHYAYANGQVPANSVVINNGLITGRAINPVVYKGIRVSGLVAFNDDWNLLVAQSYQNMEADGVFAEMRADSLGNPQPSLSVQLYNPSWTKDKTGCRAAPRATAAGCPVNRRAFRRTRHPPPYSGRTVLPADSNRR